MLLQEGEKLINVRQKNVLIADKSEHGWATVAKYEEDKLADNSDDKKRLFRPEVKAGRKLKPKKFLTQPPDHFSGYPSKST